MDIKILGSVSPYCKDDKNCVGYLIKTENSNILLDCGNGISRYMDLSKDLNNLTIIISHLHKDHYGELLSLGYASHIYHNLGYIDKKIKVYIPIPNYDNVIEKYIDEDGWGCSRTVEKQIEDYHYLMNFGTENYMDFFDYSNKNILNIDNVKISFCQNPHQINTFSIKLQDNDGVLVYSSDTGFKENCLVKFARKCDILLCESTFLKGQNKLSDNHLFAFEAAMIAKKAEVNKLILTHFWPEIDKEKYVNEAKKIFEDCEAAVEGKVLKIGSRL